MVKSRSVSVTLLISALMALEGTATLGVTDSSGGSGDDATLDQSAVAVVGTSTLVAQTDPGTTMLDGRIVRVRDSVLVTVEESSDPRVSGRATITVNLDAYPNEAGLPGSTQVRYGEMRLQNEDGSWRGHFAGSLANGGFVQTYWLEGDGAYKGLSYVVTAGGNGNVWRSQGLIYPGEVPPLGSSTALPIDRPGVDLPTVRAASR